MNLTQTLKALKIWNTTKEVNGFFIRRRAWDKKQWQIVDSLDFDKANVIEDFYYQKELANRIRTK